MFLLDFTRKPFQLSEKQVLLSILKTGQKFKASFAKQGLSSADLPFLSLIDLNPGQVSTSSSSSRAPEPVVNVLCGNES